MFEIRRVFAAIAAADLKVFIGNISMTYAHEALAQRAAISAAQRSALTRDVGVAPTTGHFVPLEGEIIAVPACMPVAKAGRECK